MTALVWNDSETVRMYEVGVDRGVLYPSNDVGVVWNGLLSVNENVNGGDLSSYASDGVTCLNSVGNKDYQATVKALSTPKEFAPCLGLVEIVPGFFLTKQRRKLFGFSYRTLMADVGYKIHLVYNVTASPTSRSYSTLNDTPTPVDLEWQFNTVPETYNGYHPTAHYVVDTTKTDAWVVSALEDILYGNASNDPSLPTVDQLISIINGTSLLIDGGSASSVDELEFSTGSPTDTSDYVVNAGEPSV